jgi:hypothetical protein
LDCTEYFDFSCSLCSSQGASRSTKPTRARGRGRQRTPSRLNSVPGVADAPSHRRLDRAPLPWRGAGSGGCGGTMTVRRRVTSISTRCFRAGLSAARDAP